MFSYLLVQDVYVWVGNNSVDKKAYVSVSNDSNVHTVIGNSTRILQFLKAYYLRAVWKMNPFFFSLYKNIIKEWS